MPKNIFRKLFRYVFAFSIFYFLFSIDFIHADVPNYINYQGRLRYQGQPVSGTRNFVFGIYTQASGGAATWEENEDVKVSTGIYSHSLGSGNLVTGNWSTIDWASIGANCYLSVNVGGSGELLPRMKFEAVPYSFVARQLWDATNNIVTSGGNVGIGTTNPLTELYVVGTTSITSNAWIDGDMNLKGALKAVGNVGIGTTNPLTNLYVVGTTSITSNAWIDGNLNVKGNIDFVGGELTYYKRIVPKNTGYSVFIGEDAGRVDDLTDNYNCFIGHQAGYTNTTGLENIFIGHQAGYTNNSGRNIFIGYKAGYANAGTRNTFIGVECGAANNSGYRNTFIGYWTGLDNTVGNNNCFLGYIAGANNISGVYNSIFGSESGNGNTTGSSNSLFGYYAGRYSQTGSKNVCVGANAGRGEPSQSFSSSTIVGAEAGYKTTTGSRNTLIGYRAGYDLTTGGYNIVITTDASSFPAATDNSKLNIGDTIYGDLAAQNVGIGTTNPSAALHVNGDIISPNQTGVYARRTFSLSVPDGTSYTTIELNTEKYDYGDMHDELSNTERVTIPAGCGGRYMIIATCRFNTNSSGYREMRLCNTNTGTEFLAYAYSDGQANANTYLEITRIEDLDAGDYLTIQVRQTSGGGLNIYGTALIVERLH